MSTQVPQLFAGLVDDAAVFPPGSASLPDAVAAHRRQHRVGWYADLVGPLLVPASEVTAGELDKLIGPADPTDPVDPLVIGLIGDTGTDRLPSALSFLTSLNVRVRQVEVPVARRSEDPQPGLATLLDLVPRLPGGLDVYAEVPLTWGLMEALDTIAEARTAGAPVAAKFRTGGLAAELFPTPAELAAVICACRDRRLPFKLTAGLHHAIRHIDPETGFTHHGFVNVLSATLAASDGAGTAEVAEMLATTDPVRLVERARARRDEPRPLWIGYGSCSVVEPLTDLIRLGLVNGGYEQ
ncbi:hypothetical protein V6U90_25515 [Micromonospora sp. CPCC 206060]|uniref:hypothetical protein n=1 Tax=Micromonospora sp. CPCC 206060 TaxID=3122406 RepID=UPI002FF37A99